MEKEVLKKQIQKALEYLNTIDKGMKELYDKGVKNINKLELTKGAEQAVNAYIELILEGNLGALEHFYYYAYEFGYENTSEGYSFDGFFEEIWGYFKVE